MEYVLDILKRERIFQKREFLKHKDARILYKKDSFYYKKHDKLMNEALKNSENIRRAINILKGRE